MFFVQLSINALYAITMVRQRVQLIYPETDSKLIIPFMKHDNQQLVNIKVCNNLANTKQMKGRMSSPCLENVSF